MFMGRFMYARPQASFLRNDTHLTVWDKVFHGHDIFTMRKAGYWLTIEPQRHIIIPHGFPHCDPHCWDHKRSHCAWIFNLCLGVQTLILMLAQEAHTDCFPKPMFTLPWNGNSCSLTPFKWFVKSQAYKAYSPLPSVWWLVLKTWLASLGREDPLWILVVPFHGLGLWTK